MFDIFAKNNKGFTILELLITISIISIGLLGILGITPLMLSQSSYANSRLIAVHLAQEGIELVKNMRDYNLLSGAGSWDNNIGNGGDVTGEMDYTHLPNTPMNPYASSKLCVNSAGFYGYSSCTSSASPFWREIKVVRIDDNSKRISVSVYWRDKSGQHEIRAEDIIFNYWE